MPDGRRVLVLDPTWPLDWAIEDLRGAGVSVERADRPGGRDVIGLLVSPEVAVGAAELARLPRLEAVATNSTGFDNLDVETLAAAGVWCSNVAGYCTEEVAEHTIALVLALLRGVAELDRRVRAGEWDVLAHPPRRLAGAVLGIAGCGRIGRAVATRAAALGLTVRAYDPLVPATEVRRAGAEPVASLHELLAGADCVTLHLPLSAETAGLVDAAALAAMRPGAYLVNCARAGLVDHVALGESLASGHLGGAALDVLPREPPAAGEPALRWPRTILNPHAAWYSPEAYELAYRLAARDLAVALTGGAPAGALARPSR
ncbi:MAG: C-terminal binding protein [Thermoleophilia bacterium]|nr:C-terminal binding protein [Thermoleophilia bacterium]